MRAARSHSCQVQQMRYRDIQMSTLRSVLSGFVVSVNGVVDVDATLEAVKTAWITECEASATRDKEIEAALNDTFVRLNTDKYPTPEVVSITSAILAGSDITQIATVADEVRDYLSRSTKFKGERGRNGGLRKL